MSILVRPFGVKLLVALDAVLGMLLLVIGLIMNTRPFPTFQVFNGLPVIVFGLIDFVLAYAVWSSRKWAWAASHILTPRHRCFRICLVCEAANGRIRVIHQRFGNCVLPNATRRPTLFRQRPKLASIEGVRSKETRLAQYLAAYREVGEANG